MASASCYCQGIQVVPVSISGMVNRKHATLNQVTVYKGLLVPKLGYAKHRYDLWANTVESWLLLSKVQSKWSIIWPTDDSILIKHNISLNPQCSSMVKSSWHSIIPIQEQFWTIPKVVSYKRDWRCRNEWRTNLGLGKQGALTHYDHTSMHFNAIFHGSMNSISEMKICNIFLILWSKHRLSQWVGSNKHPHI